MNRLTTCQIEITRQPNAIELFPGSRLLAVVASPEPGIDPNFASSLSPRDECELVSPSDIVVVDDPDLAKEVTHVGEDAVRRDLDVINGTRKSFYG